MSTPLKKNRYSGSLEEEPLFGCFHAPMSLPLKKVRSSGDFIGGSRQVSEALAQIESVSVQRQDGVSLTLYRLLFSRQTVLLPHLAWIESLSALPVLLFVFAVPICTESDAHRESM